MALLFAIAPPAGASDDAQLHDDVEMINSVVERYENAGGWFSERDNAHLVMARLAYADGDYGLPFTKSKQVRLLPVTAKETPSSGKFAFWNSANNRFQLWRGTPPPGAEVILRFKRSFRGAPVTGGAREKAVAAAYAPAGVAPSTSSASTAQDVAPPSAPSAPSAPSGLRIQPSRPKTPALDAPLFDPPGGVYPMSEFKLKVRLVSPTLPDGALVLYSIGGSAWQKYQGRPIEVAPGQEVLAFASAEELEDMRDSEPVAARYRIEPVRPRLRIETPAPELHRSAFAPGSEQPHLFPSLALLNESELPTLARNAPLYEVLWTLDGSDPLSSPTAFPVRPDENSKDALRLPLELANLLGEVEQLRIRAVLRSRKPTLMQHSEEVSCLLKVVR